jgi:hypothetical protein
MRLYLLVLALWFGGLQVAQAAPGWRSAFGGATCKASAQEACVEAWGPGQQGQTFVGAVITGTTTANCRAKFTQSGTEYTFGTAAQDCNFTPPEPTCEGGQPQGGMFRTALSMGTGRCQGGCQVALADMSYAGGEPWAIGAWAGSWVTEITGQWVKTGATCTGSDVPSPVNGTKPQCGPDQTLGSVNGSPMCLATAKTTPQGDGQPGTPSGPAPTTEAPRPPASDKPTDKFNPALCGNALAVRDPMGGGTLCVHFDGIDGPPNMTPVSWADGPRTAGETTPRPMAPDGGAPGDPGGGGEGGDSCGLPDTAPCKIDETGTPTVADVSNATSGAAAGLDASAAGHIAGIEGMGPGGGGHKGDLELSWLPMVPVGSCQEISMQFRGQTYTTSMCWLLAYIRAFLQWGALFMAALYIWRRTTTTISGQAS